MPELSDRSRISQIGAHQKWAACDDPAAATSAARAAFLRTFEDEVDPDRVLSAEDRSRRAEHARKAHYLTLAQKSAASRRKASALMAEAEAAEAALSEAEALA